MNKKADLLDFMFLLFMAIIIFILIIIIFVCIISLPFLKHGSSVDIAYGVETNNVWNILYLKDDHSTKYCIDDYKLLNIAKQAARDKSKVEVTYEEYLFRGSLCNMDDRWSGVVVTNIEVLK